jgi:hypothetical protein
VARIEKLATARARVERTLDRRIEQEVLRARRRGASWPQIVRALAGGRRRGA